MPATATARIGCSGWSYKDWKGPVYPTNTPARTWFARYAELFDTVEINNTFYRLPAASTVDGWAAGAGPVHIRREARTVRFTSNEAA